jgi:hypothetical protein
VRLDREVTARGLYPVVRSKSGDGRRECFSSSVSPDMLDDGVRVHQVEPVIPEFRRRVARVALYQACLNARLRSDLVLAEVEKYKLAGATPLNLQAAGVPPKSNPNLRQVGDELSQECPALAARSCAQRSGCEGFAMKRRIRANVSRP